MRIIIYNSSSFGGCFDYGKALAKNYAEAEGVESVEWWIPENANVENGLAHKKLFISDKPAFASKWKKQWHFLFRVFVNPIILARNLFLQKPSWLIFNDFEQLSALIWVPVFSLFFRKKHKFAIVLHDPDRDAYPPSLRFTTWSMKKIMGLMQVAIYHDFLPEKPYYQNKKNCLYLDLPHGFYPMPEPQESLFSQLSAYDAPGKTIMAILGNIREEKNYDLAIKALAELPDHYLIIAGKASNARVNVEAYKSLASSLKVSDRVLWIEKFLSEGEMSAVIEIADVVLLNYAVSFTSQSGILNVVAPFRKELIVSDGPSSLASIIRRFGVGELVQPGSLESLVFALKKLQTEELEMRQHWEEYLAYASWENHVKKAVRVFSSF
jgi:glycosyltransferase involved in cell wall biosynthesis